jgi:hypothetical protein
MTTLEPITKGQKKEYAITVYMDGGGSEPQDLTGMHLVFTVRKNPGSPVHLIRKTNSVGGGIVVSDAAGGVATLTIEPADTSLAEAGRTYVWDLWIADTPAPVASGKWLIDYAITTDLS